MLIKVLWQMMKIIWRSINQGTKRGTGYIIRESHSEEDEGISQEDTWASSQFKYSDNILKDKMKKHGLYNSFLRSIPNKSNDDSPKVLIKDYSDLEGDS